jgi:hypothetical protein
MRAHSASTSGVQRNLRYLLEANVAPQWRDWLAELAPALVEEIGEAAAWRIMQRTGRAVAGRRPLTACSTLTDLETAIGQELARLNWGWARLTARGSGIDIVHGAYPFAPVPEDPAGGWFAAVLEGLYSSWIGTLSNDTDLSAIVAARPESVGDVILLRYSRHGQGWLPL